MINSSHRNQNIHLGTKISSSNGSKSSHQMSPDQTDCKMTTCGKPRSRDRKLTMRERRLNKRLSRLLNWKERLKKMKKASKRDYFSVCSEHCDICYKKISGDTSVFVALDCEFVGVGAGKTSALGRCSVVDFSGNVLCDTYSKPDEPITDYRTPWSGIVPSDLIAAIPFECAQTQINNIIKGKIVIGHAVHNDFSVLGIHPPRQHIIDTSKLSLLREKLDSRTSLSLKKMALSILGETIQCGGHCSVEDSWTTMKLFKVVHSSYQQVAALLQRRLNRGKKSDILAIQNKKKCHNKCDNTEKSYLDDEFWKDVNVD